MLRDGRQERRRDLVESERRHLPVGRAWPDRQCTHIARYELILDRLLQGAIHKDMERLHCLGVEPPRATYAAHLDLIIVEPLEMLWPEILEQDVPECWFEVSTDEGFVGIKLVARTSTSCSRGATCRAIPLGSLSFLLWMYMVSI